MDQVDRYLYFPRGFRIYYHRPLVKLDQVPAEQIEYSRNDVFLLEHGDGEVDKLYRDYCTQRFDFSDWNNASRAIRTAIRLIPDIEAFAMIQRNNPRLDDMSYEFLHDIARFLSKGQRDMSIFTALSLMNEDPTINAVGRRPDPFRSYNARADRKLGARYIEQWIAQKEGLADLIVSLYVLFGSRSRETVTA